MWGLWGRAARPHTAAVAVADWLGPPANAELTGRIVNTGAESAGAIVHVGADVGDPRSWSRTVTTTESGSFALSGVRGGAYVVWASKSGWASRLVKVVVDPRVGGAVELVLHPCRSVTIDVKDPTGSVPQAAVEVAGSVIARSDANGSATICAPPRRIDAVVRNTKGDAVRIKVSADVARLTATIPPHEELVVTLPPSMGEVLLEAGAPGELAWPQALVTSATTARFRIPTARPAELWIRQGEARSQAIAVNGHELQISAGLLPPPTPADRLPIRGRVLRDGRGAADVELIARTDQGKVLGSAWSTADGSYEVAMSGLEGGHTPVTLTAEEGSEERVGVRRLNVVPRHPLTGIDVHLRLGDGADHSPRHVP